MKLSIRFSILIVLMLIIAIAMYQFITKVAVPYLLTFNDGAIMAAGLIIGLNVVFAIWVGAGEFLMKVLNCGEIIDKFINEAEK